jgi:hypothetical protein
MVKPPCLVSLNIMVAVCKARRNNDDPPNNKARSIERAFVLLKLPASDFA